MGGRHGQKGGGKVTNIEQRWRRLVEAGFTLEIWLLCGTQGFHWQLTRESQWRHDGSVCGIATLAAVLTAAEEYAAKEWGYKP